MKYLSLLRGINVAGQKKIKMLALKVQATTRNWRSMKKLQEILNA